MAQPQLARTVSFSAWLMFLVTILFVLFQFFLQLSAGVMVGQLMKSFQLTGVGAGLLAGSFYFIYVLLQTPAGMLVDRFGPRCLLGMSGVVCALGCFIFACSHQMAFAVTGRVLMGVGASFAFVSSLFLVSQWFPEKRFGTMVGLVETMGMLGTLIGNVYLSSLLTNTPWRKVMLVSAFIAFLLGVCCYLIVRDKPRHAQLSVTPCSLKALVTQFSQLIKTAGIWVNGIYAGLLFSVVTVFAAFWGIPLMMLSQHISLTTATLENSLVFVGIAVGGPMMGWFYPRLRDKVSFLTFCSFFMTAICSILVFVNPARVWFSCVLFLLMGMLCSSYVLNFTLVNRLVPKQMRSTSIGFTNMLCVGTAPIFQTVIGGVLHLGAKHQHHLAPEVYTLSNYHWALSLIPLGLLVATMIARWLPKVD